MFKILILIGMSLFLTGCKMDKNSEGPVYEKFDVVDIYNPEDESSVTIEEDDEPVDVTTPAEDHTPANGEGTGVAN